MNWLAVKSIYRREMMRTFRTLFQSVLSPVVSTTLYFVVFGSAIGSRIESVEGIPYGAFIVPGLMMLTLLQQSVSNGSGGIYMPKWVGTIFELLAAPISWVEITLGFVGAAATKAVMIATIILITSFFFVDMRIAHPFWMVGFMVLTSVSFALLGFVIGIWAKNFEQLQLMPLLVITPLTFLGGAFYSASMLPPFWEAVTRVNPVLYLISGFRWAFFDIADVPVGASLIAVAVFLGIGLVTVWTIFRTGWRIRQ
ncbi:ABC transporter permease [Frigidibacter sp. ROC022]|uniref:ABC transporter permease n=1 Tax=Frigidibacter sp. ROC022 TaxID=2971796 RepID=UPI00215AA140|nr:ABC transporter permease [Frigidibacter sp. ROC022]MCR8725820.1 ABC transporter permease [Frigidibacter sp. ROC022]